MVKKIILTIIGSTLVGILILSFIDVYIEPKVETANSFTYALGEVSNDLKNIKNLSMRERDIITSTSRGLVIKNSEGKLEYDLVEEIIVQDDGLHYEFKLKDNIRWSNGKPIKAENIVDFIKDLLINEDEESIEAILNIYGGREFRNSKGSDKSKLAIIERDDSIIIRLNKQDKNFVEELTKPVYKLRRDLELWKDIKTNYSIITCSGDYIINKVDDEEIILEKSVYADGNGPKEINIVRNISEEFSMAKFETGEIDIVVNPPSNQLDRLESEGKLKSFSAKKGKYIYLSSVKQDIEKRKLIYKSLTEAIGSYYKENIHYIEPAEYSYFAEDKTNSNEIQNRKVTTTKAAGDLLEVITIMALDTQENRNLCAFIQKWFKENTKISLRYTLVKSSEYKNIALKDRYDATLIDAELLESNRKKTFEELEYWYTDEEKKLFEGAEGKKDTNFKELEGELFLNYKILPLFFENKNVAISKNVNEVYFDYYGNIQFTLKD